MKRSLVILAALVTASAWVALGEDEMRVTPWGVIRVPKGSGSSSTAPAARPATTSPAGAVAVGLPRSAPPAADDVSDRNPVRLGINASLGGRRAFPDDNLWNADISKEPVDPNSAAIIASIGAERGLHPDFSPHDGINYVVVPANQPRVKMDFECRDESEPGPYPVPPNAPIEGGPGSDGDRHVLVIDRDNFVLYELYASRPQNGGQSWLAGSGAIFDLKSNKLRPAGWTSSDAAGLPVFPGLVRGDEMFEQKEIRHAVRFTCRRSRQAYVLPARHWASSHNDPNLPPMGMRVRLKADYDISRFPPQAKILLTALKKYGMLLADNGSDWYITGSSDPRYNMDDLLSIRQVHGKDLEVVRMVDIVTPQTRGGR